VLLSLSSSRSQHFSAALVFRRVKGGDKGEIKNISPVPSSPIFWASRGLKGEMRDYYRYHSGENKLTPKQQADIMAILAKYGPTEGLAFDHYETSWDFD